jgi:HD-GYP domain-containing protein (c-di-GMP phosphodiesterase class II)
MGGDEFCALVRTRDLPFATVAATLAGTLAEHGEGFDVSAPFGAVAVPAEAGDAQQALRLADQRMYAQKGAGRATEGQQAINALLRALTERSPELSGHLEDVAEFATRVAASLGVQGAELNDIRRAAQLHDVGKVAVPESILTKPGPLDESEWEFVRRHTLVGEKILGAAPALVRPAALVRATHERFDGAGYPDGLAGEEIPLGARVIAVCDAFDAMTRDRPYRAARPVVDAFAELRRGAGTQFDPAVVEAFFAVLAEDQRLQLAS